MNRRSFLKAAGAGTLALTSDFAQSVREGKTRRVGLIGCGWYGKIDLIRLIQVAPVEVVSLCDVDSKMLEDAAERIGNRQASKKRPRTYGDYRQMLREKDLDIVLIAPPDHCGCDRRPSDDCGGPEVRPRSAGGNAAQEHASYCGGSGKICEERRSG